MSKLDFPFYPNNASEMKDNGELFLYLQNWAAENQFGFPAVAFKAYLNTNQSLTNSVATKINFDVEIYDESSNYDSDTNYRFVAPTDGLYQLASNIGYDNIGDGGVASIRLYKNGSLHKRGVSFAVGAVVDARTLVSVPLKLLKNDYIEVYGIQVTGGARNTLEGEDDTWFAGFRVAVL